MSNSMLARVLHLGKFYPPDNGGIEFVTAALARGSAVAGVTTTVLCFEEIGRGNGRDGNVAIQRVAGFKVASQPLSAAYLRLAVRLSRQADIVHVHLPNMLAALAVMRIGPGPKVVLHWHSDVVGKGWLARVMKPLESAMLRRADLVVCTSQAYADASMPLRPFLSKVAVVPIGVADPLALPVSSRQARAALPPALQQHLGERPLVLAVGRLVPYKGFAVLLDAAARMAQDAAIVIVGGGPMMGVLLRQRAAQRLQGRVLLAGRVDDGTLATLQAEASVFCLPSVERSEAFGVAIVEALAHGLPVVATRIQGSGVPWVNADTESGLNVAPGDATELALALDRLLGDAPLRGRLADGARRRYEALFSERQFIERILALYRDLLSAPAPARAAGS
jgi:glycosyltransferase involved in cell wall biosynthesis